MAAAVWYFMQPEAMIVIVAERNSINPVINGTGKISGGRKITIYADVTLELEEIKDAISIPNECIYNDDEGSYLYMIKEGVVSKVYVTTGVKDNFMTEVKGIDEGNHIVMDPSVSEYVGEEVSEIVYTVE